MNLRFLHHPLVIVAAVFLAVVVLDTKWLMPGPVSKFHTKFEAQCSNCHVPFAGTPSEKCLVCKTKMKLVQNEGIHRHSKLERCAHCHVEHRGTKYPLASAWVDPVTFDHRWTGFDLGRFHRKLACKKCHPTQRGYRKVARTCAGCHKDFVPGIWDHRKTGCDLDVLHAGLACEQCHHNKWGAKLTPTCTRCHPGTHYDPRSLCRNVPYSQKARERGPRH